jgi:H+/gluconate symporter-like permease
MRIASAQQSAASSSLQAGALLRDSLIDLQHAEQILVADKRLASAHHSAHATLCHDRFLVMSVEPYNMLQRLRFSSSFVMTIVRQLLRVDALLLAQRWWQSGAEATMLWCCQGQD